MKSCSSFRIGSLATNISFPSFLILIRFGEHEWLINDTVKNIPQPCSSPFSEFENQCIVKAFLFIMHMILRVKFMQRSFSC